MNLALFIEHIKNTKTLPEGKIFCFFAQTYPSLFFHYVLEFLKKNNLSIETITCTSDISSLKALFSTISFSGSTFYWLRNFSELSDKKQQELCEYFRAYTGPHTILFFTDKNHTIQSEQSILIELPKNITQRDLSLVRFLVNNSLPDKSDFTAQVSMYSDYLSLDNICLLAHYELVLGKNTQDFFTYWITRIIDPTNSLFILSQHFFSKKTKSFFRQWSSISEEYASTFWVSFWADQLWRAYVYCDLMKQKKYTEAKKAQYKLPFSFVNRDWSHYTLSELKNAHHFLTEMDFKLKNGGSDLGLEYFYNQFFANRLQ